jgi:DNA-binding Lrp family transcriptional regulator
MPASHVDQTDQLIIKHLRENARVSNAELARRVGLSEAQCLRRLHALERAGTILHYKAVVDLNAVGLPVMAFVELRLECPTKSRVAAFERAVDRRPELTECWRTSGDADYLLRASVANLPDYERLVTDILAGMERVRLVRTHLALRNIKASTASLPLAPATFAVSRDQSATTLRLSSRTRPEASRRSDADRTPSVLPEIARHPGAKAGTVDELDLRILYALSRNARIPNVVLADLIGLSPAACSRRVRALEARRVIRYYLTLVDYRTFDMFVVFMRLRLDRRTREWQEAFERSVVDLPSIVEAYRVEGESDYILRGIACGLDGLERLLSEPLVIRPGIQAVESAIGLRQCITSVRLSGVASAPGGVPIPERGSHAAPRISARL